MLCRQGMHDSAWRSCITHIGVSVCQDVCVSCGDDSDKDAYHPFIKGGMCQPCQVPHYVSFCLYPVFLDMVNKTACKCHNVWLWTFVVIMCFCDGNSWMWSNQFEAIFMFKIGILCACKEQFGTSAVYEWYAYHVNFIVSQICFNRYVRPLHFHVYCMSFCDV